MGMQEIKELVPKLDQLKELYQLEEFKVLREFLLSSQQQLLSEILGTSLGSDMNVTSKTAAKIAQVNMLGAILELPNMVKTLKEQFEKEEAAQTMQRGLVEDPLAKEGF
jgi:pheromone shutdown protein TraB